MKHLIIDKRMRQIEKEKLKQLGYKLIELEQNTNIYEEISAHVDIHVCKIGTKLIVEKTKYREIKNFLKAEKSNTKIEIGQDLISKNYPQDIKYNVCIIGNKAIHNFEYTDIKIKEELLKENYELINTNQGYTNCSIAVIDKNSAIVTDKGLYKILEKHKINVLYLKENLDIKLLTNSGYSTRNGFIGGAISRIGNNIVVFGDLSKIDKQSKIRDFILSKNLNIIEFEDLDIIDYGGIIEI